MNERPLEGRRAIVTGGSKGLGRLIAARLAEAGAKVALLARESGPLREVEAELEGAAQAVPCDLRDAADIDRAVAEASEWLGGADLLVNNAGTVMPALLEDVSEEQLAMQFETNLLGAIRITRAALPHLRRSKRGDIINVSSEAAADPRPFLSIYSATKAGLEAFSEALRHELRDDRIRVTVLRAGRMETGTIQASWPEGLLDAYYASNVRTGHLWRAGEAMAPQTVADLALSVACLPADATVHLVEVRGR